MTSILSSERILEYIKNPLICAVILAIATYYIYSYNYLTKKNIKKNFSLKNQRINNIKSAIYVYFVTVIIMFIFKYSTFNNDELHGGMLHGNPPF